MEPQTPESMTSSLYIVQEFMSGDTLKVHLLLATHTHTLLARDFVGVTVCITHYMDGLQGTVFLAAALRHSPKQINKTV